MDFLDTEIGLFGNYVAVKGLVWLAIIIIFTIVFLLTFFIKQKKSLKEEKLLLKSLYDELDRDPNNISTYINIAMFYFDLSHVLYNPKQAITVLDKVIEIYPNSPELYSLRAIVYAVHLKNLPKAILDVDKLLELDPNDEYALKLKKDILNFLKK